MKEEKEIKKVKCALFFSKNEIIEQITRAINATGDIKSKAMLAKDLARRAEELLTCEYFNKKKKECNICHGIAKLRKETAELIIKQEELK